MIQRIGNINHNAFLLFYLLQGARGALNLWELVSVVGGQQDMELSPGYGKGIMHKKHIASFKAVSVYTVYIMYTPLDIQYTVHYVHST